MEDSEVVAMVTPVKTLLPTKLGVLVTQKQASYSKPTHTVVTKNRNRTVHFVTLFLVSSTLNNLIKPFLF